MDENEIILLKQENMRLRNILENYEHEYERLKHGYERLNQMIKEYEEELKEWKKHE